MGLAYAVDPEVDQQPTLQHSASRPPSPPCGLAATMLDDFASGTELVLAIDPDGLMTVKLHANGLRATGAAQAVTKRFRDQSVLAIGDVPVLGIETQTGRCVNGKVSIGITWTAELDGSPAEVAGTALAEGNWVGGPFRFTTVAQHSFNRKVIRLVADEPLLSPTRRFADRYRTEDRRPGRFMVGR